MSDATEILAKPLKAKAPNESHFMNISVRGLITMYIVAIVCYMGLKSVKVEEPLYSMTFLTLGYYFGQGGRPTTQQKPQTPQQ